jgi:hypothetical protein
MKTKFNFSLVSLLTLTFVVFSLTNALAQEKSKKQLKEEKKLEKQKQTSLLVDSKEFVFIAETVMPQGGRTRTLTTNDYTVEFHPDLIKSDLPFFGRAYSGVGYGGDGGMQFEGKPKEFTIEKTKKAYEIKAEVKGDNDTYSLSLSVYFDGNANLSINSNNRSHISYNGVIEMLPKK